MGLAQSLGVQEWISLGAIPAAVPHTRAVPVMGTESRRGLLRGNVTPGPTGLLRVPAAAISVIDIAVSAAGVPAVGYFAQIPHYVSGPYPLAAVELLRTVGRAVGRLRRMAGDFQNQFNEALREADMADALAYLGTMPRFNGRALAAPGDRDLRRCAGLARTNCGENRERMLRHSPRTAQ